MYFAIEGVIGVGKTTLARMLQAEFDAELVLEGYVHPRDRRYETKQSEDADVQGRGLVQGVGREPRQQC